MIKIIAEIGWNHMGDMNLAEKMIKAASNAGADFAKFQTWSVKYLKPGPWDHDGRLEIYKQAELNEDKHQYLKQVCEANNINFLTSIFNVKDKNMLKRINEAIIKVPSHEIYNKNLIKSLDGEFENILISTGASNWSEIEQVTKLIKKSHLILMHCVSAYPCNVENINLPRINELKKLSKDVGYSGHLCGIEDAIAAMGYGVKYIEKHFTIDRFLPGRDNQFAILPDQLEYICDYRNNLTKMNQYLGKNYQSIEDDIIQNYRGRWSGERKD